MQDGIGGAYQLPRALVTGCSTSNSGIRPCFSGRGNLRAGAWAARTCDELEGLGNAVVVGHVGRVYGLTGRGGFNGTWRVD